MHPLCGTLPVPFVPVQVTHGALVAHRYSYAASFCQTSQYHRTIILRSVTVV